MFYLTFCYCNEVEDSSSRPSAHHAGEEAVINSMMQNMKINNGNGSSGKGDRKRTTSEAPVDDDRFAIAALYWSIAVYLLCCSVTFHLVQQRVIMSHHV